MLGLPLTIMARLELDDMLISPPPPPSTSVLCRHDSSISFIRLAVELPPLLESHCLY